MKDNAYQIRGRVVDGRTGRGVPGLRVEAWDKDLKYDDLLGSDETDAEGRFQIQYAPSYFKELFDSEPDIFFKVYTGEELIADTRDDLLWNAREGESLVEIAVEWDFGRTGGGDGGGGGRYLVEGSVVSPDRGGVGGLRVLVVDKNVGADVTLAETETDDRGRYSASYTAAALRGKQRPDLQARAYSGRAFLAASAVRYNAGGSERLDVRLPAASAAVPSEYETLTRSLSAHFGGRLGDLEETGERQDITYLANKTGWDARAVALAALADQFSRQGAGGTRQIDPAFYYALFRAGLPANADALFRADARAVENILKQALAQGVIPASLGAEVAGALEEFRRLGAQKILTVPALDGASSMKEMLDAADIDEDAQTRFAELYASHRSDADTFWESVAKELGEQRARRLEVDGRLGLLTVNNAPLIREIHGAAGGVADTAELALKGFHRAEKWGPLLGEDVPVPKGIPGDTPAERRANYADYLAAQVRLSYPTGSVAEMVGSGELKVDASQSVQAFLAEHQGRFEIGTTPVRQYVRREGLEVGEEALAQVERIQRVYQITPTDRAMGVLLERGLDSAYKVVRGSREEFVRDYAQDLGGETRAAQTYDNSAAVYNAVLNIAVSYLTARNGIPLGATAGGAAADAARPDAGPGRILRPTPRGPQAEHADDVLAYPTLEGLFGEMDFCACDHCRSILSPAAYLVDLLFFIDQPPRPGRPNPQAVLFERRPDLQHLPLTCENTNTALPYIDVVNETLEYFVANEVRRLSLDGYVGHDTDGAASEDLLASPQFVMDTAYTTLRGEWFPEPLPFHRPLESLRRHFEKFEAPLPKAMERLRRGESLERGADEYGWRDILLEELRLSRAEYQLLTNSPDVLTLAQVYGFPAGTTPDAAAAALSKAKDFSRRVGVSYEDLAAILGTRFVNPNSELVPKLERLHVPFEALRQLRDGTLSDDDFRGLLPTGASAPDPAHYGGDIVAWVKDEQNYRRIMSIITLADPAGGDDPCDFDALEFRYSRPAAGPSDTSTRIGRVEFSRLARFIRLWHKLGWTIEQTDAAICALMPVPAFPGGADGLDTVEELDEGFRRLLPRLGVVVRVMHALDLSPERDLLPLLALWAPVGTHGPAALYKTMFLDPALLERDAAFAADGAGQFLSDPSPKLLHHAEALRSAFNLTGDEFERIVASLFPAAGDPPVHGADAALSLENLSAVYRRGWLARKLRVSVRELLALTSLTGLDPFAPPDIAAQPAPPAPAVLPEPPILQLISLVRSLRERSLKPSAALYTIWNQDLSGKSAPRPEAVAAFARTLRLAFAAVETEFAVEDDPGGAIAQSRMSAVYGAEAAAFFFGLLNDTLSVSLDFTDLAATLADETVLQAVTLAGGTTEAGSPKLAYDDFRKRLSYAGVLSETTRVAIKAAAPADAAEFRSAVDELFDKVRATVAPFFERYAELRPLYDAYAASAESPGVKRGLLLEAILPELVKRRKAQQALQSVADVAQTDLGFARALLETSPGGLALHAAGDAAQPALQDLLALERQGLSVRFFAGDTTAGAPIAADETAASLEYAPGGAGANPLPANPTPGDAISGVWRGYVEAPESGFFNLRVEAEAGAAVAVTLGGQAVALAQTGEVWHNAAAVELRAGALYQFELTVERVRERLRVLWEWTPKGQGCHVIPPRYLYPASAYDSFRQTYVRFLKAASLARGLGLGAAEMAHFATDGDYRVGGDNWLNALAADGDPAPADAAALVRPLRALLDFARIKAELSPGDDSLLSALRDPAAATAGPDAPLFALTRWDRASLDELVSRFGGAGVGALSRFELFRRVYDAFELLRPTGLPAAALARATTNEPTGDTVRDLQAALRARYDAADWREVVRPINDSMRALQRDALVAHILHKLRSDGATAHIDTPDKLFEYFLMDVQMEPCMLTSRVRHALSSVQLFVERCLMNLEGRVRPASLDAKQWEWMKRYRVWEANRKVFLYPENWLEPELRDDKSPFFKEIESELLQADITDETAAAALLNYLSKLEEVAKLEPVGIYHEEASADGRLGAVDHVVARSAGARSRYYYRRRSGGAWSPWEQIKLDIENTPVLPYVWKGRLLLFWLRVITRTPVDPTNVPTGPTSDSPLSETSVSALKSDAVATGRSNSKVTVQGVLCWSEYFNGKWQATKTSDPSLPVELGQFDAVGDFHRAGLRLSAYEEGADKFLRIEIQSDEDGIYTTFLLYNTYGRPEREEEVPHSVPDMFIGERWLDTHLAQLRAVFYKFADGAELPRRVLGNERPDRTVETAHPLADIWRAPFFYEDARHVFFVTVEPEPVRLGSHRHYGVDVTPGVTATIPPFVYEMEPQREMRPRLPGPGGPGGPDPFIRFADAAGYVTEDGLIERTIASQGTVRYGGALVGPGGALSGPRAADASAARGALDIEETGR
ncbi:MAG TPA: neuraminidase-like domain-containing protein [Pyrinomonadaceae bacterium]|nr:neuraminidase-like domain-containing protein [Pyrinomonadaceae bacterium]